MFYDPDITKYYKLPFKLGKNSNIVDSSNRIVITVGRSDNKSLNKSYIRNVLQIINGRNICIRDKFSDCAYNVSRIRDDMMLISGFNYYNLYLHLLREDDYPSVGKVKLYSINTSMMRYIVDRLNKYYSINSKVYYEKEEIERIL